MHDRRLPSWSWVTALTVGALVIIGFLTVQASHAAQPNASARREASTAPRGTHGSASPRPAGPPAVPADSGQGRRIVLSLGQRKVWLVGADETAVRAFTVWPGSIRPAAGRYAITYRRAQGTGTDGVRVQHVVYFAAETGVSIAFSNAVDGSSPTPAPGLRTGAVRERAADGTALWTFATVGTPVVVVA